MKAYRLYGVNDLRYEDVDVPMCKDGWAIVEVKAAGICSSDIPRIYTKGTYHFPTIPGHEFSGRVVRVGSEKDNDLIGHRVGIFPLIPCRKCESCSHKRYEMCENYDYVGSRRDGGFADYVAVPVWNLVHIPDNISYEVAAMLEPVSVALHAMKLANIQQGSSVGIIGTGMIGICAGQWAYKLGASKVTVIGRSDSKKALVEKCGLNYRIYQDNEEQQLYNVVLEAVGTPNAVEQSIKLTKSGGTVVLMGNPSADILFKQNVYWRILRKQLIVRGTWNSSYDGANPSDWTEAVDVLQKEEIKIDSLITHRYPQNELVDGLTLMRNNSEPYCKVMTIWNE